MWYEKWKKKLKGIVHVCYSIKFVEFVEFILCIKHIKSYLSKTIKKKQGFFVNIPFVHFVVNEDLQITDN